MHLQTTAIILLVAATGALAAPLPHEHQNERHQHQERGIHHDQRELRQDERKLNRDQHRSRALGEDTFDLVARSHSDNAKKGGNKERHRSKAKATAQRRNLEDDTFELIARSHQSNEVKKEKKEEKEAIKHREPIKKPIKKSTRRGLDEVTFELAARGIRHVGNPSESVKFVRPPPPPPPSSSRSRHRSLGDESELVARSHNDNEPKGSKVPKGGSGPKHRRSWTAAADVQERDFEEDAVELSARKIDVKKQWNTGKQALKTGEKIYNGVQADIQAYNNGRREFDEVEIEARDGLMEIEELD